MKQPIIFLMFVIPLFCMAQRGLTVEYNYDAAGNRILRKVVILPTPPQFAPPAPPDSTFVTRDNRDELLSQKSLQSSNFADIPEYYTETIYQTEIKIYPNPTTEKVTLEISGWENLQTGVFKLYSLTGQLLQEQPVHSLTTIISLANLPKGAYILNVQINDRIEDWKIIKQ
jgi:hypothetical protein